MNHFRYIAALTFAGLLMACSENEEVKPSELPENIIVVSFLPNDDPDLSLDVCNPMLDVRMRTDERELLRLNVNLVMDGSKIVGTGQAMIARDTEGVIEIFTEPLTSFRPYEKPCSEVDLSVNEFSCRNSAADDENIQCPEVIFQGIEMFRSFRGIPE